MNEKRALTPLKVKGKRVTTHIQEELGLLFKDKNYTQFGSYVQRWKWTSCVQEKLSLTSARMKTMNAHWGRLLQVQNWKQLEYKAKRFEFRK